MDWICVNRPFSFMFWAHYTLWPGSRWYQAVSQLRGCLCMQLGQHKFGKQSHLLAIVALGWDGREYSKSALHSPDLTGRPLLCRSIIGLETKEVILPSFWLFIRVQAVVVFITRKERDLWVSPALGKMHSFLLLVWVKIAVSNFLRSVLAKRLYISQIPCLQKVPLSHKNYLGEHQVIVSNPSTWWVKANPILVKWKF